MILSGTPGEAVLEDRVSVPRVYLMFHAPPFPDPGFEPADVLCSLLSEGRSSRLYRALVYEQRVAADVSAFVWPSECVGMLWVVANRPSGRRGRTARGSSRGGARAAALIGPDRVRAAGSPKQGPQTAGSPARLRDAQGRFAGPCRGACGEIQTTSTRCSSVTKQMRLDEVAHVCSDAARPGTTLGRAHRSRWIAW